MFLTTHAAVGIAISQHVGSPLAAFGWSFASHFLLDFIPHGDEKIYGHYLEPGHHRFRRAIFVNTIDIAILIGMTFWAIGEPRLERQEFLLLGILGSIIPDMLTNFFPIIHERLSWLRLVRWVYAVTKPTGLRYVIRVQDWIHKLLHHEIIRSDIPFVVGLVLQALLIAIVFATALPIR